MQHALPYLAKTLAGALLEPSRLDECQVPIRKPLKRQCPALSEVATFERIYFDKSNILEHYPGFISVPRLMILEL